MNATRNPYEHVAAIKCALRDGDTSPERTGIGPADRAIAFAWRHPAVAAATLAACGLIVAKSPTARAGLWRTTKMLLRGWFFGAVFKKLGDPRADASVVPGATGRLSTGDRGIHPKF